MENQIIKEVFAQATMNATGFIPVKEANVKEVLEQQYLGKSTKLYDAIITSNLMLLETLAILKQLNTQETFQLVHIVITDGYDNSSKASLQDVNDVMDKISEIPSITTHIIDIETDNEDLQEISDYGGEQCQYHYVSEDGIQQIFEQISIQLALREQTQIAAIQSENFDAVLYKKQIRPELHMKINRYCVMLTVDTSYSMDGTKFDQLLKSVNDLQGQLSPYDFIACIKFDDDIKKLDIEKSIKSQPVQKIQRYEAKTEPQVQSKAIEYREQKYTIDKTDQQRNQDCCNIF